MWLINLGFVLFVTNHYKYEMYNARFEKHIVEENLNDHDIIENLEEAIITKNENGNGIGFCNKQGFSILHYIYKYKS
jgi:hypothetical protein